MKGNRGTHGLQLPPIEVPIRFGGEGGRPRPPEEPGTFPWAKVLLGIAAAIVILLAAAASLLIAFGSDDSTVPADPTEPTTPVSASATATGAPATPIQTPVAVTVTQPATAAPTVSPTRTPVQTATLAPSPTATPTPTGPPTVRTRYVVQSGDACEVIRQKFKFANADFEDFQLAMGVLSGRNAGNRCVMRSGDVLCIPTQQDLGRLGALAKDDACLAGS